jgi:16S rRNA (cytosine1402-N4)-methyltransferase
VEGPNSARFCKFSVGGLRVVPDFVHRPVLVDEVTRAFGSVADGTIVDATLGAGGHAEALLRALRPEVSVVGIDRDPQALHAATQRLAAWGTRFTAVHGDFRDIAGIVDERGCGPVTGILLDLGVSSPQLDDAHRGFSHSKDAALDMRMDPTPDVPTAADIVNTYPESELRRIIRRYGEERFADRIARAIVRRRDEEPFTRTVDLAAVVTASIPAATRRTGRHPARRTFQALRIEVNGELDALDDALAGAVDVLEPGGRLVVIAYHSLEDRAVKRFLRAHAPVPAPRGMPVEEPVAPGTMRTVTAQPVSPSEAEIAENPRARSARMRIGERT